MRGLSKADPVLLEPVDHVTISVPNDYTARAQRLLTGRRGQILGFAERSGWVGWDDVEALVPEAGRSSPSLYSIAIAVLGSALAATSGTPRVPRARAMPCWLKMERTALRDCVRRSAIRPP